MVEEEVAMEKSGGRGDCQKIRETSRKASANSCSLSVISSGDISLLSDV